LTYSKIYRQRNFDDVGGESLKNKFSNHYAASAGGGLLDGRVKHSVAVKLQTGFFERTDYKLKITAEGLTFQPVLKDDDEISIPAWSIREVTFYEAKLKMEIHTKELTDAFFANEGDWLDAMKAIKEALGIKIFCELN